MITNNQHGPAHPKPGEKIKKVKKTSRKKIREIEKPDRFHCRFCGEPDDDTSYYHHCEDPDIKFLSGGGITSGKIPDQLTVWGHHLCGTEMSEKPSKRIEETQEAFTMRFYEWKNKWKLALIKTWLV